MGEYIGWGIIVEVKGYLNLKQKKYLFIWLIGIIGCTCVCVLIRNQVQSNEEVTIYLIRHAQTEANEDNLLLGSGSDADLTDQGIQEAETVGQNLQDITFSAAYCSTLNRTYHTANLILKNAGHSLEIEALSGLDDISWGQAEGMTQEEAIQQFGDISAPYVFGSSDDASYESPIGAENLYSFVTRFDKTMENIAQKSHGNVLVVSHSAMIYWLQQKFPDLECDGIQNTAVTILKYKNSKWTLVDVDDTNFKQ